MATSEILNIIEAPILDESIEKFEFHEYEPVAGTTLNSAGGIFPNVRRYRIGLSVIGCVIMKTLRRVFPTEK